MIGVSTTKISEENEENSNNQTFYLGYGNYSIICLIMDSLGGTTKYIIENIETIITTDAYNNTKGLLSLTDNFLDEQIYDAEIVNITQIAAPILSVLSVFDYLGRDEDSFQNNINITRELKDRRSELIDYLIDVIFDNLTSSYQNNSHLWRDFLEIKTELCSAGLRDPNQIYAKTGVKVVFDFAATMETLNNDTTTNSSFAKSNLNDATANAIVSGVTNIGLAFINANKSNDTSYRIDTETTIELIQLTFDLLMIIKLKGTVSGEKAYYFEYNQLLTQLNSNGDGLDWREYEIVIDAMKQSVDNLNEYSDDSNTICGGSYMEYQNIGHILKEQNVSTMDCLFSIQPYQIFENVDASSTMISNILSLKFANDDRTSSEGLGVVGLISSVLQGTTRRRLAVDSFEEG